MSAKIAPLTRRVAAGLTQGGPFSVTEYESFRAELRALLTVARAAEGVRRYVLDSGYEGLEGPADKALFRALARLRPRNERGMKVITRSPRGRKA